MSVDSGLGGARANLLPSSLAWDGVSRFFFFTSSVGFLVVRRRAALREQYELGTSARHTRQRQRGGLFVWLSVPLSCIEARGMRGGASHLAELWNAVAAYHSARTYTRPHHANSDFSHRSSPTELSTSSSGVNGGVSTRFISFSSSATTSSPWQSRK